MVEYSIVSSNIQDTNAECKESCTNNADCVGYDFDNNLNECWIHEDQNNFDTNTKTDANGVTQYRKIPCGTGSPGVCVVTYTSTNNRLSFGGSRDTSAVSENVLFKRKHSNYEFWKGTMAFFVL